MRSLWAGAVLAAMLLAAACGGGSGGEVDISFRSEPDPPAAGENMFDVRVTSGGQPVTDAEVAVEFFMPAMPAMNMAEMRNSVPLAHQGGGQYRGSGYVMMAGGWDVTVTAKRNGQVIGTEKLSVTAK